MKFSVCVATLLFLLAAAWTLPRFLSSSSESLDFNFKLTRINGEAPGDIVLSEAVQEGPILIYFWATWCPTCEKSIPVLNQMQEQSDSNKWAIYAVNFEETEEEVRDYLVLHEIRYPVYRDRKGLLASRLKVSGMPSVALLAKGGKILYYGFSLPEPEALQSYLEG